MDSSEIQAALRPRFGELELSTAERDGFRAVLISPPAGGNWSNSDRSQLRDAFVALGIRRGIMPNVETFSGRVAGEAEASELMTLGDARSFIRFIRPCEGGPLDRAGFGLVVTLGGCMLIVARGDGQWLMACHAGFRSLADIDALGGATPRRFESVVDSIAYESERRYGIRAGEIDLECFFGLMPGALIYHYERNGAYKRYVESLVSRWGKATAWETDAEEGRAVVVDPGAIFLAQAHGAGFRSATRSCDITADGPFANTRHTVESLAGERRNLGVILRTG